MADPNPQTEVWVRRMLFVVLALVIMFSQLLPLPSPPERWPGPDLLVALCFAWAFRRPDYVPALTVAGVFLLADLLFQRPPGLWAALMVLATEFLKRRTMQVRDMPYLVEWMTVASTLLIAMIAYRATLSILLIDQAPLGAALIQTVMTILAYPIVAALSQVAFGVRKAAPGEVDALGHRL